MAAETQDPSIDCKNRRICVYRPTVDYFNLNYTYEVGTDYRYEYVPPAPAGHVKQMFNGAAMDCGSRIQQGYYRVWPGDYYDESEVCTPEAFNRYFSKVATPQDILNLVALENL